jgi:hypothetical protein
MRRRGTCRGDVGGARWLRGTVIRRILYDKVLKMSSSPEHDLPKLVHFVE